MNVDEAQIAESHPTSPRGVLYRCLLGEYLAMGLIVHAGFGAAVWAVSVGFGYCWRVDCRSFDGRVFRSLVRAAIYPQRYVNGLHRVAVRHELPACSVEGVFARGLSGDACRDPGD